ncbi:MAG: globin domain protein [Rhodobacteraceae bacterium]|nr:globin domain protein [Paracoccaceae bacterium]
MDHRHIALIQTSFAKVFKHKGELADRFYARLFEALPESRALFTQDFSKQKDMFEAMLASTVRSLGDTASFENLGERLALNHRKYGVDTKQYMAAADALTAALKDVMGDALSEDEERAWSEAVHALTGMMAQPIRSG